MPTPPDDPDGVAEPEVGRPVVSTPITAPPAPRRLRAPHNLFTLAEVAAALQLLDVGLVRYQEANVLVTWKSGSDLWVPVGQLARIDEVEDVLEVYVRRRYTDGSDVSGDLIHRPTSGWLLVKGGGQAQAAANDCMDHLRALRPQRATVRRFLAGTGPLLLVAAGWLVLFICSLIAGRIFPSNKETSWIALAGAGLVGVVITTLVNRALSMIQRRVGGTRLARPPQVNTNHLTPEVGVLAALISAVLAVPALIVGVLSLWIAARS